MRARPALIAMIGAIGLVLSGCASSIAGSPLAAQAPLAGVDASGDQSDSPDVADNPGLLPMPTDSGGPQGADLGGLLGGLDEGQLPDMSQLGELLDGLGGTGGVPDIAGLLDGLGGTEGADIAGLLGEGCLEVSTITMSLGFLLLAPALGQPLTAKDVTDAFAKIGDVPSEVRGDVDSLRAAAEQAVGKSPAEAQAILSSTTVTDAMEHLSKYIDAKCAGS